MILVNTGKYRDFCYEVAVRNGIREAVAREIIDCMVMTDMFGIWSHGTVNLKKYIKKAKAGGFRTDAEPTVMDEGPTWLRLDGHDGFGMYNGRRAMDLAIQKASEAGIAFVSVKNSGHFGACSAYTVYAAEKGYMAFALSNTNKNMCVPGGKGNIIGNSPISYALPRSGKHPVFMDIALSQIAKLKVIDYQKKNMDVPLGWVVDSHGQPTTKPQGNEFSLCPMAAHKGYCLSFLVEYLTAVLSGGTLSPASWLFCPDDVAPGTSHAFLVMDVRKMLGAGELDRRTNEYTESIVLAPKADGSDKIYYPGEINWISYDETERNGMLLPDSTETAIREVAEVTGLKLDDCKFVGDKA